MTISYKTSDNIKEKMIDYYKDLKREKTPDYALFQADEGGSVITLYESGKVVIQGISADIDANMWFDLEASLNGRNVAKEIELDKKMKDDKKIDDIDNRFKNVSTIGSDEVGTGDYFGPIVVTASYVSKENINFLYSLGVRDSKKLTDQKVFEIAPKIIKNIPHKTVVLSNEEYNSSPDNIKKLLAKMHNEAFYELTTKGRYDYKYIVLDQFTTPRSYFTYIYTETKKVTKLTFVKRAEDKCLSVAASAIISRYIFLKELEKIGNKYNIFIQKGASSKVDNQAALIVRKHGFDELKKITKYNFANTNKVKEILKVV